MSGLVLYGVALFFALSACHFARGRRTNPRAIARYSCYATALLAAALLLLAPPTVQAADRLHRLGIAPAVPVLLGDVLRIGAACAIRLLAGVLRDPEGVSDNSRRISARRWAPGWACRRSVLVLGRTWAFRRCVQAGCPASCARRELSDTPDLPRRAVRRQLALLAGVLGVRAVLFVAAAPGLDASDLTAAPSTGARLALAGYTAAGVLYLAYCLTALLRQLARLARAAAPGRQRSGLRLLTLSLVAGLLWNAWGVDDVVQAAATGTQAGAEDALCGVLGLLCVALLAAGLGTTVWPAAHAAVRGWLRAHRRYRALAPLWRDLHTVLPEIALAPASRLPLLPPRDPQFALYRRIIEIHDARLILRQHLDPRTPRWLAAAASRFPPSAARAGATAEAAALAAALERAAAGARPNPDTPRTAPAAEPPHALGQDLESEADHLAHLTRVYATCPAVAEVRARARAAAPSPAAPDPDPVASPAR
ncbi:MAB_1171c family putative transporter [Kitasatospora sp. NPDC088264]|uniref:MAB_1171c family putative transporter n=1 Tax=unclassified Kitasatospora TaxID=2633591 RepID=UPI00343F3540